MNETETCAAAIAHFGRIHQITKAVEELGELSQALARWLNGEPVYDNICEEIADVEIMLEQLRLILGKPYEAMLSAKKAEKIAALALRLAREKEDHGAAAD